MHRPLQPERASAGAQMAPGIKRRSFFGAMIGALSSALAFRSDVAHSSGKAAKAVEAVHAVPGKIRRVVTGHDPSGKSIIVSDSEVEAVTLSFSPGSEQYNIWGADTPPTIAGDESIPPHLSHFPPVGGFRFAAVTIPPQSSHALRNVDMKVALAELESKMPGLAAHLDPAKPGMHRSDTVDYEYILSGEVWLELGDGQEVLLRAGDTVVQNGTRHAWHNRGEIPCHMVVCLVGAHHRQA